MSPNNLAGTLRDPPPPRTMHEPKSPDDDPELAHRNLALALALWALSIALFGGTVVLAWIYLLLD